MHDTKMALIHQQTWSVSAADGAVPMSYMPLSSAGWHDVIASPPAPAASQSSAQSINIDIMERNRRTQKAKRVDKHIGGWGGLKIAECWRSLLVVRVRVEAEPCPVEHQHICARGVAAIIVSGIIIRLASLHIQKSNCNAEIMGCGSDGIVPVGDDPTEKGQAG
jgi:hypothetical protein